MKNMHVSHHQEVRGSKRYEVTKIFAPGNPLVPVELLEGSFPVSHVSEMDAAQQSLMFGEAIAEKLAKKCRADGVTLCSNVPGAVEAYGAPQQRIMGCLS